MSTMKNANLKRKRKSRFSALRHNETRRRTWIDLIEMASILKRDGMIPISIFRKDSNTENSKELDVEAKSLALLAAISAQGASKCIKLLPLRRNEGLWKYLRDCYMFPIFQDSTLTSGYSSIRSSGGTISLELVEALIEDQERHTPTAATSNIALPKKKPKKLNIIASKLNVHARNTFLFLFFKLATAITTICSFFSADRASEGSFVAAISRSKIADKLSRYMSYNWDSQQMQSLHYSETCRKHMVDGWFLVTEVMKIALQELTFEAEEKLSDKEWQSGEGFITHEDVMESAQSIVHHVVSELAGWIFGLFSEKETPGPFLKSLFYIFNDVALKLGTEMGLTGEQELPEELIIATVEEISNGSPTMPQIRYDAARFLPKMRKNRSPVNMKWDPKAVLLRCRSKQTMVLNKYSSYLDAITQRPQKAKGTQRDVTRTSEYGFSDGDSSDEYVPGTPPLAEENECVEQHSMARELNQQEPTRKKLKTTPLSDNLRADVGEHVYTRPRGDGGGSASMIQQGSDTPRKIHKPMSYEFIKDGDVSDIEENDPNSPDDNDFDDEQYTQQVSSELSNFAEAFNRSIEEFYSEVLGWAVVPADPRYKDVSYNQGHDLLFGNSDWLKRFLHIYERCILKDVTTAYTLEKYRNHWKTIIAMEVRGAVSENVSRRFPELLKNPTQSWTKDIQPNEFLRVYVKKVSHSRFLTNLTCSCGDPYLTRRIVDEMRGGSLCLGYAESKKGFTELSIIACRRICYDKDDVLFSGREQAIRTIDLSLAVSRERFKEASLGPGSTIRLLNLMHFSTFLRTFKAIEESFLIPKPLLTCFYGKGGIVELPFANKEAMEATIDRGTMEYLQNVKGMTNEMDDSQYDALLKVFSNMGTCTSNSSSLSLIQGPPGTGKTQTICNIVGGAFHHSKAGHIDRAEVNHLKNILPDDEIFRASTNLEGLRILIACPSNQAVDNILRRIKDQGISDGKGRYFQPQCVRIAREDYNYEDLAEFSINSKALPIDIHWLNRQDPHRKRASNAAKKAFGKECFVVLTTLATSGGIRLKELKMDFDIIIIDEAGQTIEPETLMPIVASCKRSRLHRCHVIQVGDHKQLRPMSSASHMVKTLDIPLGFSYPRQVLSQFERLFEKSRCSISVLTKQYRMHPDIARIHSGAFYNSMVESPLPPETFSTVYNQGWVDDDHGFSPFTIIDTSKLEDKFEYEAGPGQYSNIVETHIISETLNQLKKVFSSAVELRDNVSIIAPYRYAIDNMNTVLRSPGFALHDNRYGDIAVQTVDSMQGREKDVIIFSAIRSNRTCEIGFVANKNRLNVALSRARKLLVIVGDMSTLCGADTVIFKTFYRHCEGKEKGCQLLTRVETKHSRMSGHVENDRS